jgi:hypothetical protein
VVCMVRPQVQEQADPPALAPDRDEEFSLVTDFRHA